MSGGSVSGALGIFNQTSSSISGFGTLVGSVTNQTSATLAVTGGSMIADSGITNSATVTVASGDTLSSASGSFTNNTGGTVTITGSGVLTDTSGSGGISNAGGTITIGTGTVSANGSAPPNGSNINNSAGGLISLAGGFRSSGVHKL